MRMDLLNIGLQVQLRARDAIILSKVRNFEFAGNYHARNKTQIIKVQPGHFKIFHSIQTVFKLLVLVVVIVLIIVFRPTMASFTVLDTSLSFTALV